MKCSKNINEEVNIMFEISVVDLEELEATTTRQHWCICVIGG